MSYTIAIVKWFTPLTCEKDRGVGAAFSFSQIVLTPFGVNRVFNVWWQCWWWSVCVCVYVWVCVCVCVCNFTFLCSSIFLKYSKSVRLHLREYIFKEAERQIFGSINIFLFQTVLALPLGILQAFAVLMRWTVSHPKPLMMWQKRLRNRAAATFKSNSYV